VRGGEDVFVSVIIPVYNGAVFLRDAVESVLAQPYNSLEIIVIDDGSTDRTPEVAAALQGPVRVIPQLHRGLPASRNHGLRVARGDAIGFLDADDLWSRDKLALQLALLRANPAVPIVLGHTQLMRLVGSERGRLQFAAWGAPALALSPGSALFGKSVFEHVGPFDESQAYCDDLDWFMRAKERGIPTLVHPEVTLFYRRHTQNMTNDTQLGKQFLMTMLKKSIDRRGRAAEVRTGRSSD
jgi:glycosyltransferase involved in cell wall biosynthesis